MRVLFLFLDGVGLGVDDPQVNPLVGSEMPNLERLLNGRRLTQGAFSDGKPVVTERATLLALDAALGVRGIPQSATGQATLLTGVNIPQQIGEHYGPKPTPEIARYLNNGNLFSRLVKKGRKAALLNAYPPGYFAGIRSGKRLYSAIPQAVTAAGIPLYTEEHLRAGEALAADFTGEGWREHLKISGIPILTPFQAGVKLNQLAQKYHLALFEYWLSDTAGHHQDMESALSILKTLDSVLGGLLDAWDDANGLILVTSDHGNLEDLSTRRHTDHPVPALLIGNAGIRQRFAANLHDLAGITPAILDLLGAGPDHPA
jgi:hypothetical protein